MFSLFFINRPIFATVIAILTICAGVASYFVLPVGQYPEVTPPVIRVETRFPGADARTVADTVAQSIEQEVNGVEGSIYMSSSSNSDGSYSLDITFELGTNVDIASVLVQNRVATAVPRLPQEVQRQGVTTRKQSTNIVQVLSLSAQQEPYASQYDDLYLSNFVNNTIRDELSRVPGVGSVNVIPVKDYSMRIWLDPNRLKARELSVTEITNALRAQNVQVAAGQIGQPPAPEDQYFQYILTTQGRLTTEEEFRNIIVKTGTDGRITRLREVADVELGARSYDTGSRLNGKPSATIIIYQQPGANAVAIAEEVQRRMQEFKREGRLPPGTDVYPIYDTAEFVKASVKEVYKTLIEAVILVILVVMVFLGSWRATLIPLITIPVSLIGTFAIMYLFGFSINLLTLFGLILAIGIVVDDAIVVVENVERNLSEYHLAPKEATIRAMSEVFGPIIAISLVLMAVFIPASLLGGITGQLYRQFALTIAASTFLSAINALTLSPAVSAILLKSHHKDHRPNLFNRTFNAGFGWVTDRYRQAVRGLITVWPLTLLGFFGVMLATFLLLRSVPTGFLPLEDNGFFVVNVQLPDAASQNRTVEVVEKVADIINKTPGVSYNTGLPGFSLIAGNGSNKATLFATLEPWDKRLPEGHTIESIRGHVQQELVRIKEAQAFTFQFPPIPGLGTSAGFDMRLVADPEVTRQQIQQTALRIMGASMNDPTLQGVFSAFRAGVPQYFVNIDREKVLRMGVSLQSVFETLSASMGSAYVNDFNKFGRTYQVNVQADSQFRRDPSDVLKLEVRAPNGGMVPFGSFAKIERSYGPERIERYNMYQSASFRGEPKPGYSSSQAMDAIQQIFDQQKSPGMRLEWSGISYQEKQTAGQATLVFAASIIVVYLILAAQYESWSLPMSVAFSIPLAIIGAMLFLIFRGFDNNIYTQIGLVLLVGLTAKNAILIVEFARTGRQGGKSIRDAAVDAATTRFRPILMTSFAFIMGCVPLMLASGAGANSRQALGTAVVGGMLGAMILGVLFIPVLYYVVQRATELVTGKQGVTVSRDSEQAAHAGA